MNAARIFIKVDQHIILIKNIVINEFNIYYYIFLEMIKPIGPHTLPLLVPKYFFHITTVPVPFLTISTLRAVLVVMPRLWLLDCICEHWKMHWGYPKSFPMMPEPNTKQIDNGRRCSDLDFINNHFICMQYGTTFLI